MPIRRVPGSNVEYFLISYDADGRERLEADGTLLSRVAIDRVADASAGITDVFFTSHGWKGDIKAAVEQYDSWTGAMAGLDSDRAYALKRNPAFKPLIIGLHWPSLPFGDENVADGSSDDDTQRAVNAYASRIADTPVARDAIRSILDLAKSSPGGDTLTTEAKEAYDTLFAESKLGSGDIGSAPGADQEGWDPQRIIDDDKMGDEAPTGELIDDEEGGILSSLKDHLLSPLRQASFWSMKRRARLFGESGAHELLGSLQRAGAPTTRFHLMGHSFGCIVVSGTIAGAAGSKPVPRPVDSLFLVQGALSLWAYAADIPYAEGTPGYFHQIINNGLVSGPIVTTRSKFDRAVGRYYPLGARVKRQYVLVDTEYPKYGGVGTFGLQGLTAAAENLPIKSAQLPYGFKPRTVYNIEASRVIKNGPPPSGAHSDIAHPEVAHIFWEAALAGM
jgi:hypothetical protein